MGVDDMVEIGYCIGWMIWALQKMWIQIIQIVACGGIGGDELVVCKFRLPHKERSPIEFEYTCTRTTVVHTKGNEKQVNLIGGTSDCLKWTKWWETPIFSSVPSQDLESRRAGRKWPLNNTLKYISKLWKHLGIRANRQSHVFNLSQRVPDPNSNIGMRQREPAWITGVLGGRPWVPHRFLLFGLPPQIR